MKVACLQVENVLLMDHVFTKMSKNEKKMLLAHLLGSTLKNQELLDDDWLVNSANEPIQSLLTGLSFLCTEFLHLKCWKQSRVFLLMLQSRSRIDIH